MSCGYVNKVYGLSRLRKKSYCFGGCAISFPGIHQNEVQFVGHAVDVESGGMILAQFLLNTINMARHDDCPTLTLCNNRQTLQSTLLQKLLNMTIKEPLRLPLQNYPQNKEISLLFPVPLRISCVCFPEVVFGLSSSWLISPYCTVSRWFDVSWCTSCSSGGCCWQHLDYRLVYLSHWKMSVCPFCSLKLTLASYDFQNSSCLLAICRMFTEIMLAPGSGCSRLLEFDKALKPKNSKHILKSQLQIVFHISNILLSICSCRFVFFPQAFRKDPLYSASVWPVFAVLVG